MHHDGGLDRNTVLGKNVFGHLNQNARPKKEQKKIQSIVTKSMWIRLNWNVVLCQTNRCSWSHIQMYLSNRIRNAKTWNNKRVLFIKIERSGPKSKCIPLHFDVEALCCLYFSDQLIMPLIAGSLLSDSYEIYMYLMLCVLLLVLFTVG